MKTDRLANPGEPPSKIAAGDQLLLITIESEIEHHYVDEIIIARFDQRRDGLHLLGCLRST